MREEVRASLKPRGFADLLRLYYRPVLVLVVAFPLTGYAVIQSLDWFTAPFPGFFLMANGVVPTVGGIDWPKDKGTLFHSQVVAVDGIPVRSSADVYGYVAARPAGTVIQYTFRKDGAALVLPLPSMVFTVADYLQTYGILLFFGFSWLVFGVVVGIMQPRTRQARVYLFQALVAGLYPVSAVFLHRPNFPLLTTVYFLLECFFPATWIHLALVFPVERHFVGRQRLWLTLPYLLSTVLAISVLRGFASDPPDLAALHGTYLYTSGSIVFFIAAMTFAYWENREPTARLRTKAVLPGLFIATLLPLVAFANNAFSGRDFPVQFGLLFTPIGYASLAYAIARRDLFDIDRVVRQSFVYAVLSVIVIGAYALALIIPARLVPAFAGENQAILGIAFVLILAFALNPLRLGVQSVVDRAFFRTRLDYRATISQLSEVMTTLLDLKEVVAQATRVVTEAMHLESTTLCLLDAGGGSSVWSRGHDAELRQRPGVPCVATLATAFERAPQEFSAAAVPDHIADAEGREQIRSFLARIGAVVVLPLMVRRQSIGVLAFGQQRSGRAFGSDDIALLRTLANQTAIAVQNARSYQSLQDLTRTLDEKVRQQTDELRQRNQQLSRAYQDLKSAESQLVQSEKMASLGQLVAGVAHELNNPVSFVCGGLANLADYLHSFIQVIEVYERVPISNAEVAGSVDAVRARLRLDYLLRETPQLLRICQEGSERIKKIVDDLRVFVRADQGERILTDLTEGIDSTVRLLGDRLNRGGIVVQRDYAEVPRVEVNPGQLNQAWMNLLGNAIDAVEGQPAPELRIVVRLRPGKDGAAAAPLPGHDGDGSGPWVEVEIRDNGVGIRPAVLSRVFEPFFTTKPIGRGTGLGLSIAYGAIKSCGGTITISSEPGHGTAVTVRLPVRSRGQRNRAT
jgi:signal transduction histidine kinase